VFTGSLFQGKEELTTEAEKLNSIGERFPLPISTMATCGK